MPYQLNCGHVLLPPEVLLIGWAHSRQGIVGVHDHMDAAVQQGMEGSQTTWKESQETQILFIYKHTLGTPISHGVQEAGHPNILPGANLTPNHHVKAMIE